MNKKLLFLCALAGTFASAQNVGIGTTAPKSKLDVEGDMNIRKLGEDTGNSTYLAWNPETKNLAKGKPIGNIKYMKFFVKAESRDGWITSHYHDFVKYNTRIDATKYDLYVTNYVLDKFMDKGKKENWKTDPDKIGYPRWLNGNDNINPDPIVKVEKGIDKDSGKSTWYIIADVPGGDYGQGPGNGNEQRDYGPAFWQFETLIMTKGFSNSFEAEAKIKNTKGALDSNPLGVSSFSGNDLGNDEIGEGKVGVGTPSPEATLQVEGKLRIADIKFPGKDVTPLKIDNESREIIAAPNADKKPIKVVKYYVSTSESRSTDKDNPTENNTRDRLDNLYTGIPVSKYNFLIVDAAFIDEMGNPVPTTKETVGPYHYNPILRVKAKKAPAANETTPIQWKVEADFVNAGPDNEYFQYQGNKGTIRHGWQITALVIDKDYIGDITSQNLASADNKSMNVIDGIHRGDDDEIKFGDCVDNFLNYEYGSKLKCPKEINGLPTSEPEN